MEFDRKGLDAALLAIADGYDYKVFETYAEVMVVVTNPDFQEDDGSDVNLVIEVLNRG